MYFLLVMKDFLANSSNITNIIKYTLTSLGTTTIKPVNKVHQWEIHNTVFLDKWSLFRGYFQFVLKEGLFKSGLYLQGGFIWRWPLIQV